MSGVDLSEEGYDYQNDESASLEDQAAHPGQYKNSDGNWTNTCSGKKFVIKIFTKQSGYVNFTVDGNINSPLALNQYLTPDGNELYNRAMLIGPFSGDFKFEDCYSLAVNLSDNYGWNYDICYANNSISYGSGSKSDFDNATLRYVVTDDPDLIERTGYYNSPTEYELYMGAPAAAVDSITIESMDEIPDGFN